MFKLRKVRWARHVAQMGEKKNTYRNARGKETTRMTKA
jgi:hypothetical protein